MVRAAARTSTCRIACGLLPPMHAIAGPHRHRRCFRHPATMPEKAGVEVYRYARRSVRRRVHIWPEPRPRGVRIGVLRIIAAFSSNNDRTLRSAALPAFGGAVRNACNACVVPPHETWTLSLAALAFACRVTGHSTYGCAILCMLHVARSVRSVIRVTRCRVALVACASICNRMPCGRSYDGGDGRRHQVSPVDGMCQRRSAAFTSDPAMQRKLAVCALSALHRGCESFQLIATEPRIGKRRVWDCFVSTGSH